MFTLARDRVPENPVTRFAPSVTGWLHLGHVAHAAFVWGIARACGARVVLRLDDHDRGRFRPEYETSILDDLEWLKLEPDDRYGSRYRQGEYGDRYAAELTRLSSCYRTYACECTRAMIGESSPQTGSVGAYSGRCRDRGLARAPGRGVRVVVEPGVEKFTDVLLGELHQDAAGGGDPLLVDRAGNWTYHLSVVADDLHEGVNLVIRGEDLLHATGRQIRLARMLGRTSPPVFLHHQLIQDDPGNKLSKRDGALGVRELRAQGITPEELLGLAVHRVGLTAAPKPLAADELAGLFGPTE
ncbi:MAG: glutamate--tRNA ligase family protein [Gammaproteobacteria bacterium]|nr:glutamate--tRNA ligase family protein [Gammaproteobacteria bacterium]